MQQQAWAFFPEYVTRHEIVMMQLLVLPLLCFASLRYPLALLHLPLADIVFLISYLLTGLSMLC